MRRMEMETSGWKYQTGCAILEGRGGACSRGANWGVVSVGTGLENHAHLQVPLFPWFEFACSPTLRPRPYWSVLEGGRRHARMGIIRGSLVDVVG